MQWLTSLVTEYEGRPMQKAGMLTKDQLSSFFQESAKQFHNPEFKQLLSVALNTRGPGAPEEMVNGMQKEIFESMGVQGDFGIKCLCRVSQVYASDAAFLRQFYEHVQKEEMVLDEAEMPETAFRSKYEQLSRFRSEMVERMEKLKELTPEEQNVYMSNMYKEMIAQGTGADECCSKPEGCGHRPAGGPQAPAAVAAAGAAPGPAPGAAATGPGGASAMTEAEQLAFFASLGSAAK